MFKKAAQASGSVFVFVNLRFKKKKTDPSFNFQLM